MGYRIKQKNGSFHITDKLDTDTELGSVPAAVGAYVSVKHVQVGPFCVSTFTLNNVPQTVTNGTEYQSTQIYDFPEGRLHVLGCTASLQQKTTSALATTINASSTMAFGLGTAAASATTLATTMVDLLPSTNLTSSATINVAGTAVGAALAAAAQFDGTSTAKDMYLNTAYATTTDVDGDGTQTMSGTIVLTWINLGDY